MIEQLLKMAFLEDLSSVGDVTSDAVFTDNKTDTYWLSAKQDGVLCGKEIFALAFHYIDKECKVDFSFSDKGIEFSDGDKLINGQKVAKIQGL
ncbi:nicotinate-nucleotide pyrophosphorylase [Candidatus Magnetoovum chiemensis]|nr:nicotinate-nucleotide pyrophosphorylase [Candidatus Magnetoovum chiemensis]